jgi:hypothetical protein
LDDLPVAENSGLTLYGDRNFWGKRGQNDQFQKRFCPSRRKSGRTASSQDGSLFPHSTHCRGSRDLKLAASANLAGQCNLRPSPGIVPRHRETSCASSKAPIGCLEEQRLRSLPVARRAIAVFTTLKAPDIPDTIACDACLLLGEKNQLTIGGEPYLFYKMLAEPSTLFPS